MTTGNGAPSAAERKLIEEQRRQVTSFLHSTFWVDGDEYRWGDMEYGELEEIENYTGQSASLLDLTSVGAQIALTTVIRRRRDPQVTYDQIRALTMEEMVEVTKPAWMDEEPEAPATKKGGGRSPRAKAASA
jgi:hypothetical protein